MLVFDLALDRDVCLLKVYQLLLLSNFLVLDFDHLEFVLHLVLELNEEAAGDLAYCSLRKLLKGAALSFTVNLLEFLLEDWCADFKGFGEGALETFLGFLLSSLALRLAYVRPGSLDVGDCTTVYCVDIRPGQVVEHVSTELLAVHHLRLDPIYYLAAELHKLLNELWAKLLNRNFF